MRISRLQKKVAGRRVTLTMRAISRNVKFLLTGVKLKASFTQSRSTLPFLRVAFSVSGLPKRLSIEK
jgi:hypothetical protein